MDEVDESCDTAAGLSDCSKYAFLFKPKRKTNTEMRFTRSLVQLGHDADDHRVASSHRNHAVEGRDRFCASGILLQFVSVSRI